MAYQPEELNYEAGVYQLEQTDRVLGGAGGVANLPLLQLANRTKWLKNAVDTLESGGGPFAYNASAGTLPTGGTNGVGVAGIKRKDTYYVTVAGTVSGATLQIGDQLTATVDEADDISEFIIVQSNTSLATATVIGMVKLAQDLAAGSQADAVLSVAGLITLFAKLASPAFTGTPTTPTPADNSNSTQIANTAWVVARILEEATARGNGDSAEANARANADNALQTDIDNVQSNVDAEATTRGNADAAMVPYLTPTGFMGVYPSTTIPANWLACNGAAVSRTTYSALFAVIGTTFGVGDNSTTFNLPNMGGKFVAGYTTLDSDYNAINKQGGEKKHTLSINEMPSHHHFVANQNGSNANDFSPIDNAHPISAQANYQNFNADYVLQGRNAGVANAGLSSDTGGGQQHENRPPFVTLQWMIKI